MTRLLDTGLERLTVMVYKMGEVAESAINISLRGFMNRKDATAAVRELSDVLGTMTVEIENKAFELIAKYQPVASDLRIINSYMKIAYDFERYGRYAWDVSFIQKKLAERVKPSPPSDLMQELIGKVCQMVSKSVEALKQHDADLAKSLAATEAEVDDLFFAYLNQLSKSRTPKSLLMSNLLVSRYLERVADHTTYVGEAIVYIVTGEKISLR